MMRPTRRQWFLGLGAGALIGGGYVWSRFRQAVGAPDRRVAGRSSTITTRFGVLEYAVAGSGPPLLMIHGTGGGFDQGLRFAHALKRLGHRIIAPSRFGYLRSDFPADPSLANQADAFAALLDHLAIDRLAVAGGSAGALQATVFALRPPARSTGPGLPLLAKVSQAERTRAFAILSDIMPIGARAKGMLNDARQAGHPAPIDFSQLRIPLLLISAEDDRFGTAATARQIAAVVPQAELTVLPDGGHIWLGHNDEVAQRMHRFLALSV